MSNHPHPPHRVLSAPAANAHAWRQYNDSSLILWFDRHTHVWSTIRNTVQSRTWLRVPMHYAYLVYYVLVLMPLEKLYLNGPRLYGWGFWGGRRWDHICSDLTQVNAEFWVENREECANLIERHFYQFVVALQVMVYFYFLFRLLSCTVSSFGGCFGSRRRRWICCGPRRKRKPKYNAIAWDWEEETTDDDHHNRNNNNNNNNNKSRDGRKRLSVSI